MLKNIHMPQEHHNERYQQILSEDKLEDIVRKPSKRVQLTTTAKKVGVLEPLAHKPKLAWQKDLTPQAKGLERNSLAQSNLMQSS